MDVDPLERLVDWVRHRRFGKYRGTVKGTDDPTNRARLKVRVPAVLGDLEVWAMPCVPYAGKKAGLHLLPEVGTGVWVEFEAGDPSYPIWTGCFWADEELPEEVEGPATKVLRTQKTAVVLDDKTPDVKVAVDKAGELTVGDEVVIKRDKAQHIVSTSEVKSSLERQSIAVTTSSVTVNDGALEVK